MQGMIAGRTAGSMPGLDIAEQRAWQNFLDTTLRLHAAMNRRLADSHKLTLADVRLLDILDHSAAGSVRSSRRSLVSNAFSVSRWVLTDTYSPSAMETAPASRPATARAGMRYLDIMSRNDGRSCEVCNSRSLHRFWYLRKPSPKCPAQWAALPETSAACWLKDLPMPRGAMTESMTPFSNSSHIGDMARSLVTIRAKASMT